MTTELQSTNRKGLRWLAAGAALLALAAGAGGLWWFWPRSNWDQAQQALDAGDLPRAEQALWRHLAGRPNDWAARLQLAELLKRTNAGLALEQLRQIPESAPEFLQARRHEAEIQLLAGNDIAAEQALKVLEAADPGDFAVQLSLAELYFHRRDYAKALPYARRSIERQPERTQSYVLLAEVLDELNRTGEMVDPLRDALRVDPGDYEARRLLVYALLYSGRLEDAENEARRCLETNGRDAVVHRYLAHIARDRGRHDEAIEHVQAALELAPDDFPARLIEADLLIFQRKGQQAYDRLKPLYAEHAHERRYLSALARAAAVAGKTQEAEEYQRQLTDLIEPDSRGIE